MTPESKTWEYKWEKVKAPSFCDCVLERRLFDTRKWDFKKVTKIKLKGENGKGKKLK